MLRSSQLQAIIVAWPAGLLTFASGPIPMPVAVPKSLTGEPTCAPMEVAEIVESTAPPSLAEATTDGSEEDDRFTAMLAG